MKTYKNLWAQFISPENFDLAAKKAVKSKRARTPILRFMANREQNLENLRRSVIDGTFKTSPYKTFRVYEPKERIIYKLPLYPDHVLHHALINVLGPIWQKMFVHDSYACIPGRGLHAAAQRTMTFMRRNKYVLQCDIRKFYPSIDHGVMMDILKRKIGDRRILGVLREIIYSVDGNKNLPIGNLTSQWLGNVYMNQMDQYVKHVLHWRDYIRYCDDFCLFGNDMDALRRARDELTTFVQTKLKMEMSKSCIRHTDAGITFIGYRYFKKFILLRRGSAGRIRRRIMNIARYDDFSEHAAHSLASMYGWMRWANSYNYRRKLVAYAGQISPRVAAFVRQHLFFD